MGKALTIPTQVLALPVTPAAPVPGLQPGVHLTWNMPDGLARGIADPDPQRGLELPELPDRWLVMRFGPPDASGRRAARGWWVDSWAASAAPLSGVVNPPSAAVAGQRLTALGLMDSAGNLLAPPDAVAGPGPEAFSSYYPVAGRRFGFHDPLSDLSSGPLSYVVVGWYSQAARDPLGGAPSEWARLEVMKKAGWKVEGVTFAAATAVSPAVSYEAAGQPMEKKAAVTSKGAAADPAGSSLRLKAFEPAPDHVVVHGVVVNVPHGGAGGGFAQPTSPVPSPGRVDFTVGDSASDALASLLTDQSEVRWLFSVLQGGGLRSLQSLDALASVQSELHAQGFSGSELPPQAAALVTATPSDPSTQLREGRYWRAGAPLLVAANAGRGFRYGQDGRFEGDGRVKCRLTGQRAQTLKISVRWTENGAQRGLDVELRGGSIATLPTELGQLDPAVRELVEEALLLDPISAPIAGAGQSGTARTQAIAAYQRESTFWWSQGLQGTDPSEVKDKTTYTGVLPSPLAMSPWTDPWVTEYLEYEGALLPSATLGAQSWTLGEVDRVPSPTMAMSMTALRFSGVAPSDDAVSSALAGSLAQLLATPGLARELGESNVVALQAQVTALRQLNLLSFDLSGVDHALRRAGQGARAGLLTLGALRLVDVFGRKVALDPQRLRATASSWVSAGGARGLAMPPRALRPGRVDLRLLSAASDGRAADDSNSPLCGFLAVDYVEAALEVYNQAGESLGQLRRDEGCVRFEPAPGREALASERGMAGAWNPHLRRLVQSVLDAGRSPAQRGGVDPLTSLLALMDAVRHTVDRRGSSEEHLGLLLGSPIAVVRARVALQVEPAPAPAPAPTRGGSAQVKGGASSLSQLTPASAAAVDYGPAFQISTRLGSLSQLDDGLLAFQRDDDPARIHTPVPTSARLSDPHLGVDHRVGELPFLAGSAELELTHDGRPVHLTLLMAPGSGVYSTSGAFPRAQVALRKEWVDDGLKALVPTVSFGPLLVEPARLALPLPGAERFEWSWVHRTRPAGGTEGWESLEAIPGTDRALFPNGAVLVQEGWMVGTAARSSAASQVSAAPAAPVAGNLRVLVHVSGIGDIQVQGDAFAGTRGQGRQVEGFQLQLSPAVSGVSLTYMAHLAGIGDTGWLPEGQFCGTRGQGRRVEGFAISLQGAEASRYKLSYMAHLSGLGDTAWVGGGQFCGTRGQSRAVEGLAVKIERI